MLSADQIQDHVGVSCGAGEVCLGVVDDLLSAQGMQEVVVCRACGGDNVRAPVFRDLHGEMTDAAGCGVDQDRLIRGDIGDVDECLPCGQRGKGQRRGCHPDQDFAVRGEGRSVSTTVKTSGPP